MNSANRFSFLSFCFPNSFLSTLSLFSSSAVSFYDLQLVVIILPILTMYYFFSISSFFWKYSSFLNYFTSFLYNNVRVFSLQYAFSSCLIYNMPVILIFLSIFLFSHQFYSFKSNQNLINIKHIHC